MSSDVQDRVVQDKQPNIVVMLTDDHGQWALGCYGNREVRSPTVDWLARTGVRMENAFCVTPVCSPARATFWTGLLPSQHGIHDYLGMGEYREGPWIESETTLADILSQAGYRCGFFGKWHCGTPEDARPGFDEWFCIGRRTGPHFGLQEYAWNGQSYTEAGYQTSITTNAALRFIDSSIEKRQPFFAFIGPVATHSPFSDHPERLVDSYRDCSFVDIPQEAIHPFGRFTGEGRSARHSNRRVRQRQYYAAVTEVDEQLSRVIDLLDQRGELENTIVVYTADHGLNVGHHGLFGKGNATRPLNMLEESIRIPMIAGGWHGLRGGQIRGEPVDHADLFCTLVEAAGAQLPDNRGYPGRSFFPMLARAQAIPDWKTVQIGEYGDLRMARTHRHKLIRRHGRGADQLFDLACDPRETVNVISEPEYGKVVQRLDRELDLAFAVAADSPNSGLRVTELRSHNPVEAWRGEQE